MPVTIYPSPEKFGVNTDRVATTSRDLLRRYEPCTAPSKILTRAQHPKVILYANGFFEGIVRPYQQDLHLQLRPDDVWQAVITQFNFYVNGYAEALRHAFVVHDGQKELDLGLIDNDIAVASITMMATIQKHFRYSGRLGCGFPSVTLLGQRNDWVSMRQRLSLLPKYREQAEKWSKLLVSIFDRFVATFDRSNDEELKTFWEQMTDFVFWKMDGERNWQPSLHRPKTPFSLGGQVYPRIKQDTVPHGVAKVPFVIKDMKDMIGTANETTEEQIKNDIDDGSEDCIEYYIVEDVETPVMSNDTMVTASETDEEASEDTDDDDSEVDFVFECDILKESSAWFSEASFNTSAL
ncbi:hypothetical protein E8E11_007120 [Didymella keratinophila]|nr:hypothetical protein E8E11_007120 [Didymella keratinophila]